MFVSGFSRGVYVVLGFFVSPCHVEMFCFYQFKIYILHAEFFSNFMPTKLENKLLERIRKGDVDAFRELYSEYFQRLYLFAQKFVEPELAKDFVQDCFLELWKNRSKLQINNSFSAYLFTVVKNKCFKHFQKEKARLNVQDDLLLRLKQEELNFFMYSEKSILEFEINDRIRKTIDKLPPKCAEVFNESRFNGLQNKEIAEKLEMSVKTVEMHISKALKLFRDEFKDMSIFLFSLFFRKNQN